MRKKKKREETLQWVFNPNVAQYEVATGRPNGHKVQKRPLCDTKSGRRERGERRKANSREGDSGERGWRVTVLRAGGRGLKAGSGKGGRREAW